MAIEGSRNNAESLVTAAVHMGPMTTEAIAPMFAHCVPAEEPPVGTVASFHYSFASGGGSRTGFMMRGPSGWSDGPDPQPHNLRTWESLADLELMNAGIQQRRPGSTAILVAVEVRIHATPPVGGSDEQLAEPEQQQADPVS